MMSMLSSYPSRPSSSCLRSLVLGLVTLASFAALPAQNAGGLLVDINRRVSGSLGSSPSGFLQAGGLVYFSGMSNDVGRELWVSGASILGARLVTDLRAGKEGSQPKPLAAIGSRLLFWANDGLRGEALWITDGTKAGTTLVKDFPKMPARRGGIGQHLVHLDKLYFDVDDGISGRELWISDGTTKGTRLLADLNRGSSGTLFSAYVLFQKKVWFFARTQSWHLYESCGTSTGTKQIDLFPTKHLGASVHAVGKFLCAKIQQKGATLLYASDGRKLAARLGDIEAGSNPTSIQGKILFAATTTGQGSEPWISDGTSKGTGLLKDIWSGKRGSAPSGFHVLGTKVLFAAQTLASGRELFITDGTAAGTNLLVDLQPGPFDGMEAGSTSMAVMGGKLYFRADRKVWEGKELFVSDGTAKGTSLVVDLIPGSVGSRPDGLRVWGKTLYFAATDGKSGREPWISDGTRQGTRLLADVEPPRGNDASHPGLLGRVRGKALYRATDGVNGDELWISDGTAAGTRLVKDIRPGPAGSNLRRIGEHNGLLFFTADNGFHGNLLWKTDGALRGTSLIEGGKGKITTLHYLVGRSERYIFYAKVNWLTMSSELWRADGSLTGTVLLLSRKGTAMTGAKGVRLGSKFYIAMSSGIVMTDGTPQGTKTVLKTVLTSSALVAFKGNLFFHARSATAGNELFISDGTQKGTRLFTDLETGPASSRVSEFWVAGDRLYFYAWTSALGSELWTSDGTTKGTHIVKDIMSGKSGSTQGIVGTLGDKLIFFAISDPRMLGKFYQLYATQGTSATTVQLGQYTRSNFHSRWETSPGTQRIFFHAIRYPSYNSLQHVLSETDGTVKGTRVLRVFASSRERVEPVLVRGKLLFGDGDVRTGHELYVLDPGATGQAFGQGCASGLQPPTLTGTDPWLGKTLRISGNHVSQNSAAVIFLSAPGAAPLALPHGCSYFLDLRSQTLLALVPTTRPTWSLGVPLPRDRSLKGVLVDLQLLALTTSARLEASNALELSLDF